MTSGTETYSPYVDPDYTPEQKENMRYVQFPDLAYALTEAAQGGDFDFHLGLAQSMAVVTFTHAKWLDGNRQRVRLYDARIHHVGMPVMRVPAFDVPVVTVTWAAMA